MIKAADKKHIQRTCSIIGHPVDTYSSRMIKIPALELKAKPRDMHYRRENP